MELELTRRVQSSHIEHCGLQTLAASVGEGSREDGEEEGSREDGEGGGIEGGWGGRRDQGRMGREEGQDNHEFKHHHTGVGVVIQVWV